MKTLIYINKVKAMAAVAVAAIATLASCSGDEVEGFIPSKEYLSSLSTVTLNGTSETKITINANGHWTLTKNKGEATEDWFNITPTEGNGLTEVSIQATSNNPSATEAREGTITISTKDSNFKQTVKVSQNSGNTTFIVGNPDNNVYTVSNAAQSMNVDITSNTSWEVSSSQTWCNVSPASGNGSGRVTIAFTENASQTARTTSMQFKNSRNEVVVLTVTQLPTTGVFSIDKNSVNVAYAGGAFRLMVNSNLSWNVTSDGWINTTTTSGSNAAELEFDCEPNTTGEPREGAVTFSYNYIDSDNNTVERTVVCRVIQDAASAPALSEQRISFSNEAGSRLLQVLCADAWSIEPANGEWFSVSQTSGNGNGELTVSVEPNDAEASRTATITLRSAMHPATATLTITQSGYTRYFSISTTEFSDVNKDGARLSLNITSNIDWWCTTSADWAEPTATNGNGNRTLEITVAPNPDTTPREATLTFHYIIGGEEQSATLTIKQQPGVSADPWDNPTPGA